MKSADVIVTSAVPTLPSLVAVIVTGVPLVGATAAASPAPVTVAIAPLLEAQAMTRPYVLLLGGRHKGEPYTGLRDPLRARCRAVVAYGEAADLIVADLGDAVPVVRAERFEDVVATARRLVPPGGAVLLSPACSSYDMFDNYEQRGAMFRRLVEAM